MIFENNIMWPKEIGLYRFTIGSKEEQYKIGDYSYIDLIQFCIAD